MVTTNTNEFYVYVYIKLNLLNTLYSEQLKINWVKLHGNGDNGIVTLASEKVSVLRASEIKTYFTLRV